MPYPKTADFRKNIPGYENFVAYCPECDEKNIFNRVSDLKDTYLIDSKLVICQNKVCQKSFFINSDIVCTPYESIIIDCNELINEKKYTITIIALCQACESFFNHAIKVRVLLETYRNKEFFMDLNSLNKLSELLAKTIKKYTYKKMKFIFVDLYLSKNKFSSCSEIELYIKSLKSVKVDDDTLSARITECTNLALRKDFEKLNELSVDSLRNSVVHKYAYRPSKEDALEAFRKTRTVIMTFKAIYKIKDIEWYLNTPLSQAIQ